MQMPSSRGFNKSGVIADVPNVAAGRQHDHGGGPVPGWDELRSVPTGTQSGLRIIVLFTDGASNGVPASWDPNPGTARALRTWDFPKRFPDPDSQTWDAPHIDGLYDTATGSNTGFAYSKTPSNWNNYDQTLDLLPAGQAPSMPATMMSWHTHQRDSSSTTSRRSGARPPTPADGGALRCAIGRPGSVPEHHGHEPLTSTQTLTTVRRTCPCTQSFHSYHRSTGIPTRSRSSEHADGEWLAADDGASADLFNTTLNKFRRPPTTSGTLRRI